MFSQTSNLASNTDFTFKRCHRQTKCKLFLKKLEIKVMLEWRSLCQVQTAARSPSCPAWMRDRRLREPRAMCPCPTAAHPTPHPLETESAGRTNGGRAIRQVEGGPEEHGRAPATLRRRETRDEMAAAGRDGDAAVLEQAVGRPGIPNAEYPRRRCDPTGQ